MSREGTGKSGKSFLQMWSVGEKTDACYPTGAGNHEVVTPSGESHREGLIQDRAT